METEVQFHPRATPVIRAVIAVIVIFSLFSCAASGQKIVKKDTYKILNMTVSIIEKSEKKDSIFIDTLGMDPESLVNNIISESKNIARSRERHNIKEQDEKPFLEPEDLENIFNAGEIQHIKKQVSMPLYINMKKIDSKRIFRYKKPVKKLDNKGVVILTGDLIADPFRAVYYLSKPVFTSNGNYSIILIRQRNEGGWVWMYKKQNGKWSFLRQFWLFFE